jgi:hypothetical protein
MSNHRRSLAFALGAGIASALAQQPALRTGYFPEEEEHVAARLNQRYYRFQP